jgi:hypothetical protein
MLAALTAVRLALVSRFFGFHTGDDVEILREGFRHALAWPYEPLALRNLLVSEVLVAPALSIAAALGVRSVEALVVVAAVPFVLLSILNVCLVFRIASRWLGDDRPALAAALLYGLHWIPMGYGSTVYPRTASTSCILLAVLSVWGVPRSTWRLVVAGGSIGVAWAVRYSEVIYLLPLILIVAASEGEWKGRTRAVLLVVAGFVGTSLVTIGIHDLVTWGRPFASLWEFARYTLVEQRSSSLERTQPWYEYFYRLPRWLPVTLLPLFWYARRVRGWAAMAAFVVLPLVALSLIHHKQLRYLQGSIPFVVLTAIAGAWVLWQHGKRRAVVGLLVLSVLLGLRGLTFLSKKSMAAVLAAREIARTTDSADGVCASQSWAYGGSLYFRGKGELEDLPSSLTAEGLARQIEGCTMVALYSRDFVGDAQIHDLLERHRFRLVGEYTSGRSRAVMVFRRAALSRPGLAVSARAAAARLPAGTGGWKSSGRGKTSAARLNAGDRRPLRRS